MKDFLPLGTVVLLKGAEKRVMIIGRVQVCNGMAYKYSAVLYPEGYYNSENLFLFNEPDIQEVCFMGLQDEEDAVFKRQLIDEVEKKRTEEY